MKSKEAPLETLPSWPMVRTRFLAEDERPFSSRSKTFPLVIEPKEDASTTFLRTFVAQHEAELKLSLTRFAGILFRGFQIDSDQDFESITTSLARSRFLPTYFNLEEGRTVVPGTSCVFPTNSLFKTGGGLPIGEFHSENFGSLDVPHLQCFWCVQPSAFGGETAFAHSPSVFAGLSSDLQKRIEERPVFVVAYSFRNLAKLYAVPESLIAEFCTKHKFPVEQTDDGPALILYKPPVMIHPLSGRKTIQAHLSGEVPGLSDELRQAFSRDYRQLRWLKHRIFWSYQSFLKVCGNLLDAPLRWFQPSKVEAKGPIWRPSREHLLGARFTKSEVKHLAQLIRENCGIFKWQANDILLFDNLQILHAGMPGHGYRKLRVMLADPIALPAHPESGLWSIPVPKDDRQTFFDELQEAIAAYNSTMRKSS